MSNPMNVSMKLTLEDLASAPLKSFTEKLADLERVAKKLSELSASSEKAQAAFSGTASSVRRLGTNAERATDNLERMAVGIQMTANAASNATQAFERLSVVSRSFAETVSGSLWPMRNLIDRLSVFSSKSIAASESAVRFTRGLDGMASSSGRAATGVARVEGAFVTFAEALNKMEVRLSAAIDSFAQMALNAREAGTETRAAARGIEASATAMTVATEKSTALGSSLKDLAKLYGSLKIEQGIKSSAESAIDYQRTQTRIQNLNLGASGEAALQRAAQAAQKRTPQIGPTEALAMGVDVYDATGNVQEAARVLPVYSEAIYNMQRALPVGQKMSDQQIQRLAKFLEQRGVMQDQPRLLQELDMMQRVVAGTQGRVNPMVLASQLQYSRNGLKSNFDISFMPYLAALSEQYSNNGMNVGQVGTGLTAISRSVLSGVITSRQIEQWSKLGLVDQSKYKNGHVGIGGVAGAALYAKSPYEWIQKVLLPALQAHGINTSDQTAVNQQLAQMFPQVGADMASVMLNQRDQLQARADVVTNAKSGSQQSQANKKDMKGQLDELNGNLARLNVNIGTTLIPALSTFVTYLNKAIAAIDRFVKAHPAVTEALVALGAAIGLLLGASVFIKLGSLIGDTIGAFGKLRTFILDLLGLGAPMKSLFERMASGLGTAAGALSGLGDAVMTAASMFGRLINPLTTFLGLLLYSRDAGAGEDQQMAAKRALLGEKDFGLSGGWMDGASPKTANPAGTGAPNPPRFPSWMPAGHAAHHARHKTQAEIADDFRLSYLRRAGRLADGTYKSSTAGVRRALEEFRNASAKTTPAKIRDHWEQIRSQIASSDDPSIRALAPQVEQLAIKKQLEAELSDAQKHLSGVRSDLSSTEQTNAALVTSGVLTKDEAQRRTLAAQRAASPQLVEAAQHVEELARAVGDTDLAGKMAALIPQFQALGQGLTQFQQKIADVGQNALSNFFSAMMKGQQTWRQMGHNFVAQILNGMNKAMSEDLAQGLMHALVGNNMATGQGLRSLGSSDGFLGSIVQGVFGTKGGAGGGAGGAGGGGLFGALGSLFGNASTAASYGTSIGSAQTAMLAAQDAGLAGSTATAGGGFFSWLSSFLPAFAVGIDEVPHDMVAHIHQGEMVVPKHAAEALRSGAIGGHQVNLSIHAMDSQSVLGAMDGVKRELAQMLSGANQNLNLGY